MLLSNENSIHPANGSLSMSQSKKLLQRCIACWPLYLLILPAFIYLFIFSYVPIYGLQIAFKDYSTRLGIWGSEWVGFKQFARFINYPDFWKILKNTVVLSVYSIALFPLPILMALLVNELDNILFKKVVQMLSYMPHFLSTVVVCGMITIFLNRGNGLINNLIALLGLGRIDFLGEAGLFSHIYVWSGVWQGIGWGMIIYLAALSGVSPDLVEAARMDGASRLKIILHVNIPTIAPTILTMLILRCGSIMNVDYEKALLLQNPLNMDASQVIGTYTYAIGLQQGQFSYAAAIGLFNTVINFAFLVIVNKISRKMSDVSVW